MHAKVVIQCSWTGLEGADDEVVGCDRPAVGYVEGQDGRRIYSCEAHIGHVKRQSRNGRFVRQVIPDDPVPPATPHAISRQARHQESATEWGP